MVPAAQAELARKTPPTVSPASSRKRVLTPQMIDAARV
jgi:hypothetical protein